MRDVDYISEFVLLLEMTEGNWYVAVGDRDGGNEKEARLEPGACYGQSERV